MKGQICVITGATSGIGRATALQLGRMGANLLLVGRNEKAGRSVVAQIAKRPGSGSVEFLRADISSLADVHRVAEELRSRCPAIDVLVNNAGARFSNYQTSADGIELTFATNHLGHFLLTALLLDRLLAAPGARVITVGSGAHGNSLGYNWSSQPSNYDRKAAYGKSKLANIMFAYELARRLRGTAVTSNAVDPGGVATKLGLNNGVIPWIRHIVFYGLKRELQSPMRAAETIVYLASSPQVAAVTGNYFHKLHEIRSSQFSCDVEAAGRLWEHSVRLSRLDAGMGDAWKYFCHTAS